MSIALIFAFAARQLSRKLTLVVDWLGVFLSVLKFTLVRSHSYVLTLTRSIVCPPRARSDEIHAVLVVCIQRRSAYEGGNTEERSKHEQVNLCEVHAET